MVENIELKDDSFFGFLMDESQITELHTNSLSEFNDNHFDLAEDKMDFDLSPSDYNAGQKQSKLKIRLVELSEYCSFPRKMDSSNLKANEICIMEKEIESTVEAKDKIIKSSFVKFDHIDQVTKAKTKKCKKSGTRKNKNNIETNTLEFTSNPSFAQFGTYQKELHSVSENINLITPRYLPNNQQFPNQFRYNLKQSISGPLIYTNQSCNYNYNYNIYPSAQRLNIPINSHHLFLPSNCSNINFKPAYSILTQVPNRSFNIPNAQFGCSRIEYWKKK